MSVVLVVVAAQEAIVMVDTDVVIRVRARKVVRLESSLPLSVVALAVDVVLPRSLRRPVTR